MSDEHPINVNPEIICRQTSSNDDSDEDKKLIDKLRQAETKADRFSEKLHKPDVVREITGNKKKIKGYFFAKEVSVGPRLANHSELSKKDSKSSKEEQTTLLKLKLASEFIKASNKQHESFLSEIKNNICNIRNCIGKGMIAQRYEDDGNALARLLFLDGCAVLEFIHCCEVSGGLKKFNISRNKAALIKRDLFLFENQIPFIVLKLLMDVAAEKAQDCESDIVARDYESDIVKFVNENNIFSQRKDDHLGSNYLKPVDQTLDKLKPDHLLDLLWMASVYGSLQDAKNKDEDDTQPQKPTRCDHDQTIFNLQALKSSGVTLKPSNSRSLRSVSFSSPCFGFKGHLKLPALVVDDTTLCKLNNLAAFEMSLERKDKRRVTCFLNFLDSLIDTEQDVKDLKAARILQNRLSNDDLVALTFNGMGRTYFIDPNQNHFYDTIMNQIQDHCSHRKRRACSRWMAEVHDKYFSSPVTTMAFILAGIALALTVVQTIYTINP